MYQWKETRGNAVTMELCDNNTSYVNIPFDRAKIDLLQNQKSQLSDRMSCFLKVIRNRFLEFFDISELCLRLAFRLQVSGCEFKSRDLERESRHLVSLELHSITIAEYIKTQRIPRGLRVSLRPTLFHDNSEFCSKFEQILNKCSMDLMALTLDHLNKEIKVSQDKVSNVETQLKDSLSKDEFDTIKNRTKENVDNFKKETEKRKRQKFIRDTQDYLQKRVYKWQYSSFRPNYRNYRSTDGSSVSSSDNERGEYKPAEFTALKTLMDDKDIRMTKNDEDRTITSSDEWVCQVRRYKKVQFGYQKELKPRPHLNEWRGLNNRHFPRCHLYDSARNTGSDRHLAICLRMESRGKRQINAHPSTKGSPKPRNKLGTSVRNDVLRNAM
ncbi:unnamed protein product [Ranitomeya imitator]|uniref:Uncharacterized protein n=2 Tax=Ranitomeya imitator TaxID=111125 RepID=A0ABN9M482_9NEOB|nr:unnamed protein product [Ranitomeya imitator]